MGRQYGTDRSVFNTLSAPLLDPDGLPIVDTGTGFGSSPLGISLREQIQFGLPNATFNLLPPDPAAAISEGENPLPFWQIQTTPNITATATYDTTTQTWGVKVDPGTAPSGDYIELKTRSWVTTDDNIALRQIASLTASKGGTYAGTTQWNLTLSAAYYDAVNTALGTTVIGTVYDNTTWTSISGTTTSGGSAISSSAAWAEFTIKLTTTAAVSSSTFATLKSLLIATSTPASGGAFVVTDTFTASGTWTRPTGVTTLLAVVAVGAGGGGGGGGYALRSSTSREDSAFAGAGGGGAGWIQVRDINVSSVGSVSVGIGAGGAGGAGKSVTKAAGSTTQYSGTAFFDSNPGAAGGVTTFGTYITVTGGNGGAQATTNPAGTSSAAAFWDIKQFTGGAGGTTGAVNSTISAGGTSQAAPYILAYTTRNAGAAGSNFTYTYNGTAQVLNAAGTGAAGAATGVGGGGGVGSGKGTPLPTSGGAGGGGGGGGGAGVNFAPATAAGTLVFTAGNGGAAGSISGAGGGGGGAAMMAISPNYNGHQVTIGGGTGGNGSDGVVYVVYVA